MKSTSRALFLRADNRINESTAKNAQSTKKSFEFFASLCSLRSLWFILLAALSTTAVQAQNLLTNNPDFEANTAYYTPDWGYPTGTPDSLPGWVITLDANADGYAGAANNQSPPNLQGTNFGYIYSGSGSAGVLETAPDSRAPVDKGTAYDLWFLARCDATWGDASATVSLVWYPNQNNGATSGDPTNLDLTLPALVSGDEPLQAFHLTAVAPPGAHYAGVRISRPAYDYVPVILDDFVIMAEPPQVTLTIKKKGPHVSLHWPRSPKFQLQESVTGLPQSWQPVGQSPQGVGATNSLDYPVSDTVHFFRLAAPK